MNKAELVAAMAEKAELSKKRRRSSIKSIHRCCCRRIKKKVRKSS